MRTSGPAAGNGYEIIFQGFNWESSKEDWYKKLAAQVGAGGVPSWRRLGAGSRLWALALPARRHSTTPRSCPPVPLQAGEIAEAGFTAIWFPPASDSVSPQVGAAAGRRRRLRRCCHLPGSHACSRPALPRCQLPPQPPPPPPARSCSRLPLLTLPSCACLRQGYLPRDLYELNSKFGSEAELRDAIAVFHEQARGGERGWRRAPAARPASTHRLPLVPL